MTKRNKKILIAGASITGPALAYWLHHYGFAVTVVEKSPALRLGGQNIDVNGPGHVVAQRMGILDAVKAANTTEAGTLWVDKDNQVTASFPKESAAGLTQELEILRGDLVNILYDHTRRDVDYRFNDSIRQLEQDEQQVQVTFASGQTESFDLVIAADGIRSKTRELMFGEALAFHYLGLVTSFLTIAKTDTDTNWARWYTADESRMLLLRPDNQGTTRASINFLLSEEEYNQLDPRNPKPILLEKLAGAGWEAARLAQEVAKSDDIYLDGVGQIKAPHWSKGRFAMVGDAAYCPAPITGKGCTLALVGAYVLAGELGKHEHYRDAFQNYEAFMRPYVESVQQFPTGLLKFTYPTTRFGVKVTNTVVGFVASRPVQKLISLFSAKGKPKEELINGKPLPNYAQQRGSELRSIAGR